MPKYRIGVTEAGDAGVDLSWEGKLDSVDGAILITKHISKKFHDVALANKDKIIVHATITGYGGTVLEPRVPSPSQELESVTQLVDDGFPKNKIVIRVDPIIPTVIGSQTALQIITEAMDSGFHRYRISVVDMYTHVRDRFKQSGLPLPYGNGFSPSSEQLSRVDEMVRSSKAYWEGLGLSAPLRIESCAEPGLSEPIMCGCVSAYDVSLLGLCSKDKSLDNIGFQRSGCMCYSGKTELLTRRQQCPHGCLYCYWKTKSI